MSYQRFSKFSLSVLFLPIGFSIFNSKNALEKLNNALLISALIISFTVIVSTVFGYESRGYRDEISGFSTGIMFSGALFILMYFILISPLIKEFINEHQIIIIDVVIIISTIIIFLTMKRSVIIILLSSIILFFVLYRYKMRSFSILICIIISFIILQHFFYDTLSARLDIRGDKVYVEAYENEARYLETIYVWEEIISFEDLRYSIFGRELFNTVGNYASGSFGDRELHVDYNIILNGSGLLGLFLYLLFHFTLIIKFNKYKKYIRNDRLNILLSAMFYVILFSSLLISINGGMSNLTFRPFVFVYLGAILGYMKREQYKYIRLYNV